LAVRRDRGDLDAAVLVLEPLRLPDAAGATLERNGVCGSGVRHLERDVANAVAVPAGEARDLVVRGQRAREDERDLPLAQGVRRAIADAGLGAGVRVPPEAER